MDRELKIFRVLSAHKKLTVQRRRKYNPETEAK